MEWWLLDGGEAGNANQFLEWLRTASEPPDAFAAKLAAVLAERPEWARETRQGLPPLSALLQNDRGALSEKALLLLLCAAPEAVRQSGWLDGRWPLHFLAANRRCTSEVLRHVIDAAPDAADRAAHGRWVPWPRSAIDVVTTTALDHPS